MGTTSASSEDSGSPYKYPIEIMRSTQYFKVCQKLSIEPCFNNLLVPVGSFIEQLRAKKVEIVPEFYTDGNKVFFTKDPLKNLPLKDLKQLSDQHSNLEIGKNNKQQVFSDGYCYLNLYECFGIPASLTIYPTLKELLDDFLPKVFERNFTEIHRIPLFVRRNNHIHFCSSSTLNSVMEIGDLVEISLTEPNTVVGGPVNLTMFNLYNSINSELMLSVLILYPKYWSLNNLRFDLPLKKLLQQPVIDLHERISLMQSLCVHWGVRKEPYQQELADYLRLRKTKLSSFALSIKNDTKFKTSFIPYVSTADYLEIPMTKEEMDEYLLSDDLLEFYNESKSEKSSVPRKVITEKSLEAVSKLSVIKSDKKQGTPETNRDFDFDEMEIMGSDDEVEDQKMSEAKDLKTSLKLKNSEDFTEFEIIDSEDELTDGRNSTLKSPNGQEEEEDLIDIELIESFFPSEFSKDLKSSGGVNEVRKELKKDKIESELDPMAIDEFSSDDDSIIECDLEIEEIKKVHLPHKSEVVLVVDSDVEKKQFSYDSDIDEYIDCEIIIDEFPSTQVENKLELKETEIEPQSDGTEVKLMNPELPRGSPSKVDRVDASPSESSRGQSVSSEAKSNKAGSKNRRRLEKQGKRKGKKSNKKPTSSEANIESEANSVKKNQVKPTEDQVVISENERKESYDAVKQQIDDLRTTPLVKAALTKAVQLNEKTNSVVKDCRSTVDKLSCTILDWKNEKKLEKASETKDVVLNKLKSFKESSNAFPGDIYEPNFQNLEIKVIEQDVSEITLDITLVKKALQTLKMDEINKDNWQKQKEDELFLGKVALYLEKALTDILLQVELLQKGDLENYGRIKEKYISNQEYRNSLIEAFFIHLESEEIQIEEVKENRLKEPVEVDESELEGLNVIPEFKEDQREDLERAYESQSEKDSSASEDSLEDLRPIIGGHPRDPVLEKMIKIQLEQSKLEHSEFIAEYGIEQMEELIRTVQPGGSLKEAVENFHSHVQRTRVAQRRRDCPDVVETGMEQEDIIAFLNQHVVDDLSQGSLPVPTTLPETESRSDVSSWRKTESNKESGGSKVKSKGNSVIGRKPTHELSVNKVFKLPDSVMEKLPIALKTYFKRSISNMPEFSRFTNCCYAECLQSIVQPLGIYCYDLFNDGRHHCIIDYFENLINSIDCKFFNVWIGTKFTCMKCNGSKFAQRIEKVYNTDLKWIKVEEDCKNCNDKTQHRQEERIVPRSFLFSYSGFNVERVNKAGYGNVIELDPFEFEKGIQIGGMSYSGYLCSETKQNFGHYTTKKPFNICKISYVPDTYLPFEMDRLIGRNESDFSDDEKAYFNTFLNSVFDESSMMLDCDFAEEDGFDSEVIEETDFRKFM